MNLYRELSKLGYRLEKCNKDFLNNPAEYRTLPIDTGGTTNYFSDKGEVEKYLRKVKATRKIQK